MSDQSIQRNLGQQWWRLKKDLVQMMPKCCYMYARPVAGGNEPNLHLQLMLFVYWLFHAYVWSTTTCASSVAYSSSIQAQNYWNYRFVFTWQRLNNFETLHFEAVFISFSFCFRLSHLNGQNRTKIFCFHQKTLSCKWRFFCGSWHYLALVAE